MSTALAALQNPAAFNSIGAMPTLRRVTQLFSRSWVTRSMARRCWGSQSGSAASSNLCRLFFLNRRVGAHGGRLAQIRDRSLAKSLICHEIGICERTTEHNQSGSTFVLEQVLILR